jgi:hypothetical protein
MKLYKFLKLLLFVIIITNTINYSQSIIELKNESKKWSNKKAELYRNWNIDDRIPHYSFNNYSLSNNLSLSQMDSVVAVETNGNRSRIILTHIEMGKVIYELEQENDGSGWTNYSQTLYGYNLEGYNTEYQFDYWENGEWEPYRRSSGEFDANGNQIMVVDETYPEGAWEKSSRYSWEFDLNGNNILFLIEFWENDAWVNGMRWSSVFNGEGLEISTILSRWENDNWADQEITTYVYDENGNEILNTVEYLADEFFNDARTTSSYDEMNRLVSEIRESLIDDVWTNTSKYIISYDENGNLASWKYQSWIISDWYDLLRNSYTYSESGNISFLAESWNGSDWQLDNSFLDYTDENGNNIYTYGSEIDIYFSTITDIESDDSAPNNFVLHQNYPNPFNPATTIKYSIQSKVNGEKLKVNLVIFDVLGQEIRTLVNENQQPGNYEVSFNASDLPSGIYFYQLKTGSFIRTKKMMLLQ